jgi:hypothetical protein
VAPFTERDFREGNFRGLIPSIAMDGLNVSGYFLLALGVIRTLSSFAAYFRHNDIPADIRGDFVR